MRYYIALLLFVTATGCSRVQVSQDYDKGVNFSRFHAYAWERVEARPAGDVRASSPLLHKRIRLAIDQTLKEMGFNLSERPDFLVTYDYSISSRIETTPFSTSFGFGIGSHRHYGGVGIHSSPEINQYDVGVLVIDMYEPAMGQLVWRGRGSEMVAAHPKPEQTTEMVQRVVRAILNQFPPSYPVP